MEKDQNDFSLELVHKDKKPSLKNNYFIILLFLVFLVILFFCGIYSNSLIIMTEALFLLWSLIGFIAYLVSKKLTKILPDNSFNFGYFRIQCISGIVCLLFMWIFSFELYKISFERIFANEYVNGKYMIISGIASSLINIIISYLLHIKEKGNCIYKEADIDYSFFLIRNILINEIQINCIFNRRRIHIETINKFQKSLKEINTSFSYNKESFRNLLGEMSQISPYIATEETRESNSIFLSPNQENPRKLTKLSSDSNNQEHKEPSDTICFIHVFINFFMSFCFVMFAIFLYIKPSFSILDSLLTIFLISYINYSLFPVVKDIFLTIMEANPYENEIEIIKNDINKIQGVESTKSIHIWALSAEEVIIDIIVIANKYVLREIKDYLNRSFNFYHTNIQIEKTSN